MEAKPKQFICETIVVSFEKPPSKEKDPGCPSDFTWRGNIYHIQEKMAEWRDYHRTGRMARNMVPTHANLAERRGSWGVGKFYFRVRTDCGRVFDIYYDRAPKDASHRKGEWILYRELTAVEGSE